MELSELHAQARNLVVDPSLTFKQRMHRLATLAENSLDPPPVSAECAEALEKRVICDMYEGNAPHRPRYLLPDFGRLLREGSAFLELEPARDLDEALAYLLITYSQVPSITGYPVWLGDLDALLEPYAEGVPDDELFRKLRLFWIQLDRMFPDAFTHANLGPDDSRVARTAFRLERELLQVVPNLTLRVDPTRTPDSLVRDGVETVFACGKPHFVNHPLMVSDLGPAYGVVSCYNSLRAGGGSHTLVRLNLREVALRHHGTR
jgi:YjjI family glycine radical enzyme